MLEHHLEKLVVFVGVVNARSIRKYALIHRLSQPGVSQRISALEQHIGLQLLERSRTGIKLTKEGILVYELGKKILAQAKDTELALFSATKKEIEVKLGTYDSVAIYLIPGIFKRLERELPYFKVKLFCDRSLSIIKKIEEGVLNCGLCIVSKKSKSLETVHLYDDSFGFYKGTKSIQNKTLIVLPDTVDNQGKTILDYIKSFALSHYHLIFAPSLEIAKAMAIVGLGIAILPHRLSAQSIANGSLLRASMPPHVPKIFGQHSFYFVSRKGTTDFLEMRKFVDLIQDEQKVQDY